MIDTPHVTETSVQTTAVIRFTIPRSAIQSVMGPGYKELMDTVAAQGISATGPWFSHHLRMQPDTFDFELGVPVSAPVVASGRVQPSQLPAARVACTVYHGGYEGLGEAWGEFSEWIAAQGLQPAADLWESYVDGPGSNPDPATWRTELNRPLSR
jgi:effector-binding domain-containing protein